MAAGGLPYVGSLEAPYGALPTAIGGTRPVVHRPGGPGCGAPAVGSRTSGWWSPATAGFKDFWPRAVAGSLSRPEVWGGRGPAPARVDGVAPELARTCRAAEPQRAADRRGLRRPVVARRGTGPDRPGRGRDRARPGARRVAGRPRPAPPSGGPGRGGRAGSARRFEVPLVPPGIPGIRLHDVLRTALRARGGRILVGERVARVETTGRMVDRGRDGRGHARAGHAGRGPRPRDGRDGRRRARRRARGRHPRDRSWDCRSRARPSGSGWRATRSTPARCRSRRRACGPTMRSDRSIPPAQGRAALRQRPGRRWAAGRPARDGRALRRRGRARQRLARRGVHRRRSPRSRSARARKAEAVR